jgi:hypothetical protein
MDTHAHSGRRRRRMLARSIVPALLVLLSAAACGPQPTPQPPPRPPTQSSQPSPATPANPSPAATTTLAPTATPRPTPTATATPAPRNVGPAANTVSGRAVTEQGTPLENVWIQVGGVSDHHNVVYDTLTDANGRYERQVPVGIYHVSARITFSYQGEKWMLPLHPSDNSDSDVDSASGIVKDFVWKLSGTLPGRTDTSNPASFYGGAIRLNLGGYAAPADGTVMRFTLTPVGPLADGSTGAVITQDSTTTGHSLTPDDLLDVPLGAYTLTVTQINPDGTATAVGIMPGEYWGQGTGSESLDISFSPATLYVDSVNGIKELAVTVFPNTGG